MKVCVFRPSYYKKFQCSGGNCHYDCCSGWNINLTKNDYERLKNARKSRSLSATFDKAYKRNKRWTGGPDYANMIMCNNEEKHCNFLNAQGLCDIQLECGAGALCYTCKTFPRVPIRHVDFIEQGLSAGCEEVVRLLLAETDGVTFENTTDDVQLGDMFTHNVTPQYIADYPVTRYYTDIKMLGGEILMSQKHSLNDRILLLGQSVLELIEQIRSGKLHNTPKFVSDTMLAIEKGEHADIAIEPTEVSIDKVLSEMAARFMGSDIPSKQAFIERVLAGYGATVSTDDEHYGVTADPAKCEEAKARFDRFIEKYPHIMANIMANELHRSGFALDFNFNLWQGYVWLAYSYILFKVAAAGYMDDNMDDDDFVHAIVMTARSLSHSMNIGTDLLDLLKPLEAATLSRIAGMELYSK